MPIGIVFHWSAARYNQSFLDYHYNIIYDPEKKKASVLKTCASDSDEKAHTWHRNTGRIGIALACCYNATSENLGVYPPTDEQIETAAALAGELIKKYSIKPEEVKTHAEWATIDGYGPGSGDSETRWDLWIPNWKNTGKNLSQYIRDKALWYSIQEEKPEKPEDKKYSSLIKKYSEKYNLDTNFVTAIVAQESSFKPQSVSSSGAKGLMQLLPGTFEDCRKALKLPENADIFNPEINIQCGCYYLDWCRKYIEKSGMNWIIACGYNQGVGHLARGSMPAAGLKYANEVIGRMRV